LQDLCKRCLQYNASSAQAHDTLGAILERECAYKDAAECYEKAWRFAHMGSAATGYLLAFNYLKVKARNGSVLWPKENQKGWLVRGEFTARA
jgi:hypothetical protein